MTRTTNQPSRQMRADARDNRERILNVARAALAEHGAEASLNKIAQGAGVGAGTLYRHFPTLQSLLVAIIGDDVEALCVRGRELLTSSSPADALHDWLRAVAVHATAMRGLVASHMVTEPDRQTGTALAACHDAIRATGAALLARAQPETADSAEAQMTDLLKLVNAIAWASEHTADDKGQLDRLLTLATASLPPRSRPASPRHPPPAT
jgi:AcrR family transcriptional regulator